MRVTENLRQNPWAQYPSENRRTRPPGRVRSRSTIDPWKSIEPTVLQEPRIALRHWNELRIPTSKHAHAQRAEAFRALQHRFDEEHGRMLSEAEAAYGVHGPLISAGLREHWPALVKDRIRFLAQQGSKIRDAAAFHEYLATTRSPMFR